MISIHGKLQNKALINPQIQKSPWQNNGGKFMMASE